MIEMSEFNSILEFVFDEYLKNLELMSERTARKLAITTIIQDYAMAVGNKEFGIELDKFRELLNE